MEINEIVIVSSDTLQKLNDSVDLFYEYENIFDKHPSAKNEKLFKSMHDSLIHRFKYCIDLFWKVLKIYLIEIEKMDVSIQSPRGIIREAVKAGVFSEDDSDVCFDMVEARNKTSHTYHEMMADDIAHAIPIYRDLMQNMINRMQDAIKNK